MRSAIARGIASLGLLAFASAASADETKLALKDVPKVILDAVKAKFPGAQATEAAKETEDGKTTFEVSIKDGKTTRDVTLTSEGTIQEIETEITAADLPRAVSGAIAAKYPKAETKKAEEIVMIADGKETRAYEVVIATEAGKTVEIKLSPEGKILEEEADDEKDEHEGK